MLHATSWGSAIRGRASRFTRRRILGRLGVAGAGLAALAGATERHTPRAVAQGAAPLRLKVLTVTMFQDLDRLAEANSGEAHLWVTRDVLDRRIEIPGAYSPLFVDAAGEHGLIITGMGIPNSAASMMTVGLSAALDLRSTYIMVAGIAGTPPEVGTLGTAAWAEWVVNAGAANAIDPRELPSDWLYPYFHLGCTTPWCPDGFETGTEVFHLNATLTAAAVRLSQDVALADSDAARAYRAHFPGPVADDAPRVIKADSASSETFFGGRILSDWLSWWVGQWTDGRGVYGMSGNEDHGTMTSLRRLAAATLVDWDRVMVLRTASDFDQPYPGRTALQAIGDSSDMGLPIALDISLENAYRVGSAVTRAIIGDWDAWAAGVPPA
ncbi:MAG: purine-nucleoside phosphorylase [Dehalococcoidia bacterium]